MAENIIVFDKVNYTYGVTTPNPTVALDNVCINVKKGTVTGIIGHTGSGKSTLLQLMNGLLRPSSGKIYLDGRDIWEDEKKIRDVRFKVGLVFQYPEYQLFEDTVYKDISFGPRNMGLDENEIDKRVKEAMDFVGLPESYADKSPFELSGGEKRRAAIAGVIAMEPEVLVLDEPAAGLDPVGRNEIFNGIIKYKENRENATVIIVSHSMEDMAVYCSELIVMNRSKVLMSGGCREVFGRGKEIVECGLNIPEITRLIIELRNRGVDIREDIYTVNEAKEELAKLLGR